MNDKKPEELENEETKETEELDEAMKSLYGDIEDEEEVEPETAVETEEEEEKEEEPKNEEEEQKQNVEPEVKIPEELEQSAKEIQQKIAQINESLKDEDALYAEVVDEIPEEKLDEITDEELEKMINEKKENLKKELEELEQKKLEIEAQVYEEAAKAVVEEYRKSFPEFPTYEEVVKIYNSLPDADKKKFEEIGNTDPFKALDFLREKIETPKDKEKPKPHKSLNNIRGEGVKGKELKKGRAIYDGYVADELREMGII